MGKAKQLIENIIEDKILKKIILDLEITKQAEQSALGLSIYFKESGDKENEVIMLRIALDLKTKKETLERRRGK